MRNISTLPYVLVTFAVIALSQAGNLIRLCDTDPFTIAFYRLIIAFFLMLPFSFGGFAKIRSALNLRLFVTVGCMAIAFSSHFFAWITAIQTTKVANAAICFAFSPVFTAIGAKIFLKEEITKNLVIAIALGLIGIYFVGSSDFSLSKEYLIGDLLALLAAFLFSIHCLLGKTLRANIPNLALMTAIYFLGSILALALVLLSDAPLGGFSTKTLIGFASLAVIPTILGHASLIYVMKFFKASTVTMLLLLEPVLAGFVAYLAFGETLTVWSLLGYVFIVGGLVALTIRAPEPIKEIAT